MAAGDTARRRLRPPPYPQPAPPFPRSRRRVGTEAAPLHPNSNIVSQDLPPPRWATVPASSSPAPRGRDLRAEADHALLRPPERPMAAASPDCTAAEIDSDLGEDPLGATSTRVLLIHQFFGA